jgi:hypothetical protein
MVAVPGLPFAGTTGSKRVGIYVLDPTFTTPLQPIFLDLLPQAANSPFAISLDVAQTVSRTHSWKITQNRLLDFTTATTHAQHNLQRASVSGILDPSPLAATGRAGGLASSTLGILRRDLLAKNILIAIAETRRPVLVLTPDWTMPRAWIESITETGNEGDGEVSRLSITFVEARIISAFLGNLTDAAAMTGGASQTVDGGATAGAAVETPTALAAGGTG